MLCLRRLGLLRSFTQIHPARKCQRNSALQLGPFPSLIPCEQGFANDVPVHLLTPSFLIKTSFSATQLWHQAYTALSCIQTTALFCVSQLPFTEGFISSYPQTTFLGKDILFPESWRWWAAAMMLCVHLWWTDFPLLLEEGISFHRCTNDV